MNCQDFESLAGDLARGVPVDVRAREEARAHEAACPRCAARLADERALGAGLRGLAANTSAAAAPPRVEANLLAAFRARAAAAKTTDEAVAATPNAAGVQAASDADKVLPFARPSSATRWSWMKTAVASASAAAAAVALFMLVAPHQSQTPRPDETANARPSRDALTPPPLAPTTDANVAQGNVYVSPRDDEEDFEPTPVVTRTSTAPRAARTHGRMTATPTGVRYDTSRATRPAESPEIATSFIPLTQDAALAVAEGGQVVRVELPRTALQRFGLPMNVEMAGERVKADVLLGHDGVARAIRFVR